MILVSLRSWAQVLGMTLLVLLSVSCQPVNPRGTSVAASRSGDSDADLGMQAQSRGDHEKAVALLEGALQKGLQRHSHDTVYTTLGNAYNELDRFDDAIAAHKKALEANPRCYQAWNNLGVSFRMTNDLDEAEKCYQKALEIEPTYAEVHASLGALYIFREEPEKAIVALEKALQLDPQLAVGHANLAIAYATVGRFDEAEKKLKHAVVLGYKTGPILKERIDTLRQLKD